MLANPVTMGVLHPAWSKVETVPLSPPAVHDAGEQLSALIPLRPMDCDDHG